MKLHLLRPAHGLVACAASALRTAVLPRTTHASGGAGEHDAADDAVGAATAAVASPAAAAVLRAAAAPAGWARGDVDASTPEADAAVLLRCAMLSCLLGRPAASLSINDPWLTWECKGFYWFHLATTAVEWYTEKRSALCSPVLWPDHTTSNVSQHKPSRLNHQAENDACLETRSPAKLRKRQMCVTDFGLCRHTVVAWNGASYAFVVRRRGQFSAGTVGLDSNTKPGQSHMNALPAQPWQQHLHDASDTCEHLPHTLVLRASGQRLRV